MAAIVEEAAASQAGDKWRLQKDKARKEKARPNLVACLFLVV